MEPLIIEHIDLGQAAVDARRKAGFEAARNQIINGKSKSLSTRIRVLMTNEYAERLARKLEETNTERIRLCSMRFERLAHKFEENNAELQQALAQLQQSNREIFQRIAGLERVRGEESRRPDENK